jgi:uncharacterized ParB-like nuclease family protein
MLLHCVRFEAHQRLEVCVQLCCVALHCNRTHLHLIILLLSLPCPVALCVRFEAHQRLGLPTIKCRVRKANQQVLKMHMM